MGANRIVKGKAIPHPLGDPSRSPEQEQEVRKKVLDQALEALKTQVDGPTVFEGAEA